ncbi:MAG: hypothetical protein GXO66_00920 [Euryarchaeota archaeon]|nr:hypothetical protein [Euryarchaeota archaeon]
MVKRRKPRKRQRNPALILSLVVIAGTLVYFATKDGEEELPRVQLPDYAYKNERVLTAYRIAVAYPEIGRAVPCYCGCKDVRSEQFPTGHKSLYNCFLSDDGRFTSHGANCFICVDEMLESYEMYRRGYSLQEIRATIDAKYAGRYADPTPTPWPS